MLQFSLVLFLEIHGIGFQNPELFFAKFVQRRNKKCFSFIGMVSIVVFFINCEL